MSTDFGHAIVAFPGLPPAYFQVVDGWICPQGYYVGPCLPSRTLHTKDGGKVRFSRKERSRLRTYMSKWSMSRSWRRRGQRRSFRTLEVSHTYWL